MIRLSIRFLLNSSYATLRKYTNLLKKMQKAGLNNRVKQKSTHPFDGQMLLKLYKQLLTTAF